jgi:hypothetical protein
MKTTYAAQMEKGLFNSLAGVSGHKDRKQMLQEISREAFSCIEMAKGLQGRGDWMGSVAKLADAAGLIIQGIDLAETLPGVRMDKSRKVVDDALLSLTKLERVVDTKPEKSREEVKGCESSIAAIAGAVECFANRLNDSIMAKETIEFSEEAFYSSLASVEKTADVGKMTITARPKEEEGKRTDALRRHGLIGGTFTTGSWEPEPGNPARERKKKTEGGYDYRDRPGYAVASQKSLVDENADKIEKPEEEEAKTEETEKSFESKLDGILKSIKG